MSLANRRMASVENLSLPRRQRVFDVTLVPDGDPLPIWSKLPLDSKLPVVPSPRGSYTLYTTKVGESKYISKQHYDFDLNDPEGRARPGEYDSLHDPFLRSYFDNPRTRKHLIHNNLITSNGKVKCDVKEFNQFREYLRYRSVTELSLRRNRNRPQDSWIGQRSVRSEDVRDKYSSKESINYSKASERDNESTTSNRLNMHGRDVSLVRRMRMREEALMRKLAEKEREREEEHVRRLKDSWEDRKRRQQRLLQMEEEIDERIREERVQHIMQREKTLKGQRDRLMAKIGKSRHSKNKGDNRGKAKKKDQKKEAGKEPKQKEPHTQQPSPENEGQEEN